MNTNEHKLPINTKGQTLVEIVIVIGLVTFSLVGLVAGATASLRASRLAHERNVAVQIVTAELENARVLRDASASAFFSDGVITSTVSGSAPVYLIDTFKYLDNDELTVTSYVHWFDGGRIFEASQSTVFTKWQ